MNRYFLYYKYVGVEDINLQFQSFNLCDVQCNTMFTYSQCKKVGNRNIKSMKVGGNHEKNKKGWNLEEQQRLGDERKCKKRKNKKIQHSTIAKEKIKGRQEPGEKNPSSTPFDYQYSHTTRCICFSERNSLFTC